MKKKLLFLVIIFVAVALFAILIGGTKDKASDKMPTGNIEKAEQTEQEEGLSPEDKPAQTVEVNGFEFAFSPSSINVNAGEEIRFVFTNTGSGRHDFVIEDEAGNVIARTPIISSGKVEELVFKFPTDSAGKDWKFYCSVPGHRAAGMEGSFVIQ